MTIDVTRPLEEAVRAVPGVRDVRSTTSRGSADIDVSFDWGRNMVESLLEVEAAVNEVLPDLPPETRFTARRLDPTVDPTIAYALTSDHRSLTSLRRIALYELRPLLSSVKGVAKIGVQGGRDPEVRVEVTPDRLRAYHLTFDDVARALSSANVIQAVGRLQDHDKLYLAVVNTQLTTLKDVGSTVIRAGPSGLVRVRDVATVRRGTAPVWTRVTADGHQAVLVQVYQQRSANTVSMSSAVKAALAGYRKHIPSDVHIATWYDQSKLVIAAAGSVRDAVLVGSLLAALILLLFLRSARIMLIAAITVPAVLAVTVLLLKLLHMSFNIMTLGGMAAAVGLIIDDAIVMVEHMIRRLRETDERHWHDRVIQAASEFTRPLAGSSMSTVIIFAPLAFLSGVTGAFFKALSLTMAASLVISFFVAWVVVPLVTEWLVTEADAETEEEGPVMARVLGAYEALMGPLLRRPGMILFVVAGLVALGYGAFKFTGSGFLPHMDEGGFILDYRAPPGTSLAETDRLLRQVGHIISSNPWVQTYSRRTGLQLGGGVTEANEGDFFIRLKGFPRPPIEKVMDAVRVRVEKEVPGLDIEEAQLMEDLIGDLTAVPQPIEVKCFSDDGATLRRLGPKLADALGRIPGVVDVQDGIILAGDGLNVDVDRAKAAAEGVDPAEVTRLVAMQLDGQVATQVRDGPRMVGVRLWIPRSRRRTVGQVEALPLRAPDGHRFPLGRIATVVPITGQPQITRDHLKRMIAVTGRISGRDMGSVIRDVKQVLGRKGLVPSSVYVTLGGLYHQQQIAFKGLMAVFGAAVALVFTLLVFLFERFRVAIAVMITTLLALSAVFVGLWVTGIELNVSSMMGMTMIVGIGTEVAIFYVHELLTTKGVDDLDTALVVAGKHRMRQIMMTALAAILALSPLALGIGQGSAMQQPLAVAIVSGMAVQVPLILVVLPALLRLLRAVKPGAG